MAQSKVNVQRKTETQAPAMHVEIEEVSFEVRAPTGDSLLNVPSINPAYQWHPKTFDIASDIKEDRFVILSGHAGTGKTSIAKQIAARINQPCIAAPAGETLTVSELVGCYTVMNGSTVWTDGILPKAMREGWWLIIDEIDMVNPGILAAFNDVLEPVQSHSPRRKLMLKEKGHEYLVAHENFRIIATANTVGAMSSFRHLYPGAQLMNYATLTRARIYIVDYLPSLTEQNVLTERYPRMKATPQLAEEMVKVANLIRQGFFRQELPEPMGLRQLEDWVQMLLRHVDRSKRKKGTLTAKDTNDILLTSADSILLSRIDEESQAVVKGILERVLLGKTKEEEKIEF